MTMGPLRRIAAALCVTWLSLLLAEVPGLHACAVHSDTVSVSSHHSASQHNHNTDSKTHKDQCSCLGTACCTAALVPTGQSLVAALQIPPTNQEFVRPRPRESLPGSPEFITPFANGPPASPSAQLNTTA